MAFEMRFEPAKAEESFVDRIDFKIGGEGAQHLHNPAAHIAIERVIARPHDHAGVLELPAMQVPRRAHGDPERLGLVAARDHAAVVVRQHDNRLTAQLRLKHALAGHIEIVAVDEGDRAAHVTACECSA